MIPNPPPATFQPRKPNHRRAREASAQASPPPPPPPPPARANITQVTASFGDDQTYWHFDQPMMILPGATWEQFQLTEDDGSGSAYGVSAVQVNATTIEITMNTAITDSGNGWFYGVDGVPAKVKTTSGGEVVPSGGDVEFT